MKLRAWETETPVSVGLLPAEKYEIPREARRKNMTLLFRAKRVEKCICAQRWNIFYMAKIIETEGIRSSLQHEVRFPVYSIDSMVVLVYRTRKGKHVSVYRTLLKRSAGFSIPDAKRSEDFSIPDAKRSVDFSIPDAKTRADFSISDSKRSVDFSIPDAKRSVDFSIPDAKTRSDFSIPDAKRSVGFSIPDAKRNVGFLNTCPPNNMHNSFESHKSHVPLIHCTVTILFQGGLLFDEE